MFSISSVNNFLNNVERAFNVAGSLPVVSTVSGPLRAIAGKVHFLAATIFALGATIGTIFIKNEDRKIAWQKKIDLGVEHVIHGLANALRGTVEGVLGATIVGSFVPLTLQLVSKNGFKPILPYGEIKADEPAPVTA